MSSRSIRRHQQQVAKIRKLRNLGHAPHGHSWRAFEQPLLTGKWTYTVRPWKGYHRMCMNEPGWWVHEFHILPMRTDSKRKCRAIERGADPDELQWRDGKKPHIYYW